MDWKKTFNQGQWVVHGIFIIAILVCVGSTIFAYRLNNLQNTEEAQITKLNTLIQDLKQDESFSKIGKYLSWAEADKANDKMRELTQRIVETEEMLEFKASTELGLNIRTFNKLINSNSGMSNPTDALKVLKQKVNSLNDLAKSKKYNKVAVITAKMKDRIGSLNSKNVGGSIQISYLKTDLNNMSIADKEYETNPKTFKPRQYKSLPDIKRCSFIRKHKNKYKRCLNKTANDDEDVCNIHILSDNIYYDRYNEVLEAIKI